MNTTKERAERILGDFAAVTSYIRNFDVSDEEWVDTMGEAVMFAIREIALAADMSAIDLADAIRDQIAAGKETTR